MFTFSNRTKRTCSKAPDSGLLLFLGYNTVRESVQIYENVTLKALVFTSIIHADVAESDTVDSIMNVQ